MEDTFSPPKGSGPECIGRYKLPSGLWSTWAYFETEEEAEGTLSFHGMGDFQVLPYPSFRAWLALLIEPWVN